jgi:hypothetical protein
MLARDCQRDIRLSQSNAVGEQCAAKACDDFEQSPNCGELMGTERELPEPRIYSVIPTKQGSGDAGLRRAER